MSNFTRKLEALIKPAILVGIFLLLLGVGFCQEARGEVTVEVGAPMLSGEYSKGGVLLLTERYVDGRYAVGFGYISRQEVTDRGENFHEVDENLFIFVQRRVSFDIRGCSHDCISLGIGPTYFNATNRALGSKFAAALSVEFRPSERWSVNFRHFSNAGSAHPNMGQDMLTLGYTF